MTAEPDPGEHDPTDGPDDSLPHWFEHPLGLGGELATAASRTLLPFLVGVAGTFALCLAIGLVAEEEVLPSPVLTRSLDQLARYSTGAVMGLGWLAGLLLCLALGCRDVLVSRAVHRAATAGAATTAVPHPAQVQLVTATAFGAYRRWTAAHVGVLGFLAVALLAFTLVEREREGWLYLLVVLAVLGVFVAGEAALRRWVRPRQLVRRREIAAHWTTGHEGSAWGRARDPRQDAEKGAGGTGRARRRIRLGALLTHGAVVLLVLAMLLLNGLLLLTHPDAERGIPGGDAGPRAELSPGAERLVDVVVAVFAIMIAAALVSALVGTLLEAAVHRRERQELRRTLADPHAGRPATDLLHRYDSRSTPRLTQAVAALGAAGLCLGLSGLGLATADVSEIAGLYDGANEIFSDQLPFVWSLVVGGTVLVVVALVACALAGARGRELRNALNRRWPVRPAVTRDKDNPPPRARTGPALSHGLEPSEGSRRARR